MNNKHDKLYIETMFKDNEKLIHFVINKYFLSSGADEQELYDAGNDALLKAIRTFDESKNIKFSTYAIVCIKNSIFKLFQEKSLIKNQMEKHLISLNEPISNSEGMEKLTLENSLIIEDSYSFEDHFILKEEIKDVLKNFKYLTPMQQICLRYTLEYEGERSGEFNKIYKQLGLSRQYFNINVQVAKRKLQLIYKDKESCSIKELRERVKMLSKEYPIVKSIEEWKEYKNQKKKTFEK